MALQNDSAGGGSSNDDEGQSLATGPAPGTRPTLVSLMHVVFVERTHTHCEC